MNYVLFVQKTNAVHNDLLLTYLDCARSLRPENLGHFIESYIRYPCFYFTLIEHKTMFGFHIIGHYLRGSHIKWTCAF